MKQYLGLLKEIKEKGTYKPAARPGMPGTQSLFGYQFRHNLAEGFPLLTTKKVSFKNIAVELLWFLRGDTNIKYLVDNGCNIWNSDAYNYYLKKCKEYRTPSIFPDLKNFVENLRTDGINDPDLSRVGYKLGDCGFQYGRVWRDWEVADFSEFGKPGHPLSIDQIKTLIEGLLKTPESRRHIVTAIDPAHDQDLALYWCHCLVQLNCRPLTLAERHQLYNSGSNYGCYEYTEEDKKAFDEKNIPKYYLDCQLYQRSADSILGVPYNIASYALLTHILAKICNMVPGEFIHTFGDVHIYDNHKEAVEEQLTREPKQLPKLVFKDEFHYLCGNLNKEAVTVEEKVEWLLDSLKQWDWDLFALENYDPYPAIKAELSTGTV